MEVSKGTVIALAALCTAAGAGGAYVVTRQSPLVEQRVAKDAVAPVGVDGAALSGTANDGRSEPSQPEPAAGVTESARTDASRFARLAVRQDVQSRLAADEPGRRTTSSRPTAHPSTPVPDPGVVRQPASAGRDERNAPVPLETSRESAPLPIVPVEALHEDLVVPAQAVIGLQLETSVSSESATVEDEVIARVTRDVRVRDQIAIPASSKVQGFVTLVERGGRLRERARLGVRFTTLILPDGSRLPIDTETVFREGESATRESAAKIGGGAIGGAIIGGLLGGAKGAAIGSSIGAGTGTAVVMTGGRNAAVLSPNTPITVRLEQPVAVANERERR